MFKSVDVGSGHYDDPQHFINSQKYKIMSPLYAHLVDSVIVLVVKTCQVVKLIFEGITEIFAAIILKAACLPVNAFITWILHKEPFVFEYSITHGVNQVMQGLLNSKSIPKIFGLHLGVPNSLSGTNRLPQSDRTETKLERPVEIKSELLQPEDKKKGSFSPPPSPPPLSPQLKRDPSPNRESLSESIRNRCAEINTSGVHETVEVRREEKIDLIKNEAEQKRLEPFKAALEVAERTVNTPNKVYCFTELEGVFNYDYTEVPEVNKESVTQIINDCELPIDMFESMLAEVDPESISREKVLELIHDRIDRSLDTKQTQAGSSLTYKYDNSEEVEGDWEIMPDGNWMKVENRLSPSVCKEELIETEPSKSVAERKKEIENSFQHTMENEKKIERPSKSVAERKKEIAGRFKEKNEMPYKYVEIKLENPSENITDVNNSDEIQRSRWFGL